MFGVRPARAALLQANRRARDDPFITVKNLVLEALLDDRRGYFAAVSRDLVVSIVFATL